MCTPPWQKSLSGGGLRHGGTVESDATSLDAPLHAAPGDGARTRAAG